LTLPTLTVSRLSFWAVSRYDTYMKKTTPFLYKRAVTFGRMALPHFGHVELIDQCLAHGEYADIHLSGHEKNNDLDTRILMLKHLCRLKGIDLERVRFYSSPTVTEAMSYSVDAAPYNEVVLVLGSDQVEMGNKISRVYDTGFIINRRSTSSTEIRYFLDQENFIEDLRHLYGGDEFAISLSMVLRRQERVREQAGKI
jgi:nicotinamide mononucleotide adenylyltransferase